MKKKRIPIACMAIVLVVAVYTGYNISTAISQKHEKSIQLAQYNEKLKTLESEITELEEEKNSSNSLEFIEKVAREDLGMVRPREIVYIDKDKAEK